MENSLKTFTDHFDTFADTATLTIEDARKSRDYHDGRQLTEYEVATLKKRGQPPTVKNLILGAIQDILGAETQLRQDPKAYPRTPEDDQSAEAVTKGLRYVADHIDFDDKASDQFEYQIVEGYGGGIVEIDPETREIELELILPDRLYWDVHSRKNDFSDAKYMGYVTWMDLDDIKRMWPKKKKDVGEHFTREVRHRNFEDQPDNVRWLNAKRKRMMVNKEYYLTKGIWHEVVYCQACILSNQPSPYLDEDGQPSNPMEIQSSFVSRDGNRFGLVEPMKDPQDEVNKRGSKAVHILNVNQTMGEEGAVEDVNEVKKEKAKPDGHIKLNPNALRDGTFQFVDQSSELSAHLAFMQEAKQEIRQLSIESLASASASGRSKEIERQNQLNKVGRVMDRHRNWKRRIYRQFWLRMRQFWNEEKWVRITDEEGAAEFIGLNQRVTVEQALQEHAEKTGEEIPQEYLQNPLFLQQEYEVRNQIAELDMDIILDEAPNYINMQHEIFASVMEGVRATGQAIPIDVMIDLLPSIPNKEKIRDKLSGDEQAQALQAELQAQQQQIEQILTQLRIAQGQAEVEKTQAETEKIQAETADEYASAQQRLEPPSGGFLLA